MSEEAEACEECESGAPAWMGTFADLMSLLMCFFVLLLSFSEMDVLKFKQIAGSVKFAFGVQSEIDVKGIPKGTSIVAQEFSPGKPTPTAIIEIKQVTTERIKKNLDFTDSDEKSSDKSDSDSKKSVVEDVSEALEQYINAELIEVEKIDKDVLIRIREKGSFLSGQADIQASFQPVLAKLAGVLKAIDNDIIVSGHTDNVPINNERFRSNWVLSSARAANVVHYLTQEYRLAEENIQITAHADTQPIEENNSFENRARNRRVEIIIRNADVDELLTLDQSLITDEAGDL